ncbi:hypothetical protein K3740_06645 [Ruegeria conchae]|uniref:hypothetical protein n=1 Tax=Ruegeria conchae TaxID=981384 RepID=UPI0021A46842|nr:hypothetical protein [Ruegeria conchae]UWR04354.1 hypothetical protein K3740_06645 [Ruegeria conchae]
MTLDQIESIIREDHGGAWWALFHFSGEGVSFLPTGHKLTLRAYKEIKLRFGADVGVTATGPDRRNSVPAAVRRYD